MLHHFEEYTKYAEITGFRNVDFGRAEAFLKSHRKKVNQTELQFLDADLIATEEHLYFAVLDALQAFRVKNNISKSIAVETMLYASAERQIQRAIDHIGVKPNTKNMAVVIVADNPAQIDAQLAALLEYFGCEVDGSVLELTATKQKLVQASFGIGEAEVKTVKGSVQQVLVNLVIERMALLSTQI